VHRGAREFRKEDQISALELVLRFASSKRLNGSLLLVRSVLLKLLAAKL
jgi:hypothetical protein